MNLQSTEELIKLFKDKASKYVEINRKRKNDPYYGLEICNEIEDTFELNPIQLTICKSNFNFYIQIWSYDKKESIEDDDSMLFCGELTYNPVEDYSSSVTSKELFEAMCYDIERVITNKIGRRFNIKTEK